jgi:hypothetical protein
VADDPNTQAPPPPTAGDASSTAPNTIPPKSDGNPTDEPRDVIGDPNAPLTPTGDTALTEHLNAGNTAPAEGAVTHRLGGTLQREPTPEELPADAKVAPLGEQVAPNSAPIAVGTRPQPDQIAGVDQPQEGIKNIPSDGSQPDAAEYLSETSEQHDDADRADEDAARDADRGRY